AGCLDELGLIRHNGGLVYSVVDGVLESFSITIGEVQGGLASMTRFCVFAAMRVLKPIRDRFPEVTPISIADDATFAMYVPDQAALHRFAEAMRYYGELMDACGQKTNWDKFVILQHPSAIEFPQCDIAEHLDLFPADAATCERPRVTRGAIKFNGVGVGFQPAARAEITMEAVEAVVARRRVMQQFIPALGAQESFIYARLCYGSGAILNHQARGSEPAVTETAFAVAQVSQVRLLRAIARIPSSDLPDEGRSDTPDDRCIAESMCLPFGCGGVGFTDPSLTAGAAHAAKVVDSLPVLRRIPAVSRLIPAPSLWASSGISTLVAAASAITRIVGLPSFMAGPPQHKEAWQYLRARLLSEDGTSIYLDVLEELSGRHLQRV
ncbi:MAG: hypothetical protein ACKVKF_26110, partial [Rhodobacterales bacterium]